MNLLRPGIRLKLTLTYGGLFLLAGALLLALNYALVRRSLGPAPNVGLTFVAAPPAGTAGSVTAAPGAGPPAGGVRVFIGERPIGAFTKPATGGVLPEPLTPDGRRVSDVLQEVTNNFRDRTLHELVVKSLQGLGVMAVLSVGFGWAVAGRVLSPLHRMTATARKLSDENLHERIGLDGPDDELKELADTFDDMLARLEAAFESQKRFVANASHELRTPLSIIRTEIDVTLANPDVSPEELRRMAEVVRRATARSDALIDGLLVLARSDRGPAAMTPVDLGTLAEEALAQSGAEAAAAGVETKAQFDPAPTCGDVALLSRLAGNLIENAIRHNEPGGRLEVVTGTAPDTGEVRLAVTNTGPVIDAAEVDGLFEPFRRLGADRLAGDGGGLSRVRGAGLGLSIVRSVTVAHSGRIAARPRPGGGLVVEVFLPRSDP
ncbi:MAG TPA: HAMP domain-containing sensor histidine kinase [Acidimicrobiia bacterium]|nr:HAMP domain-containing sensor histidine kinase [Acidimicrobiia bacterium]